MRQTLPVSADVVVSHSTTAITPSFCCVYFILFLFLSLEVNVCQSLSLYLSAPALHTARNVRSQRRGCEYNIHTSTRYVRTWYQAVGRALVNPLTNVFFFFSPDIGSYPFFEIFRP